MRARFEVNLLANVALIASSTSICTNPKKYSLPWVLTVEQRSE